MLATVTLRSESGPFIRVKWARRALLLHFLSPSPCSSSILISHHELSTSTIQHPLSINHVYHHHQQQHPGLFLDEKLFTFTPISSELTVPSNDITPCMSAYIVDLRLVNVSHVRVTYVVHGKGIGHSFLGKTLHCSMVYLLLNTSYFTPTKVSTWLIFTCVLQGCEIGAPLQPKRDLGADI